MQKKIFYSLYLWVEKFQTLCRYLDSCIQDVNQGLGKVLGYITSVKGLAAIRDDVWTLLSQVSMSASMLGKKGAFPWFDMVVLFNSTLSRRTRRWSRGMWSAHACSTGNC